MNTWDRRGGVTCRAGLVAVAWVLTVFGSGFAFGAADDILSRLAEDGDTAAAQSAADNAFVHAASHADARDTSAFADAAYAFWLTRRIHEAEAQDPAALTRRLLARPAVAKELAYLIRAGDDVPRVFSVFEQLDNRFGAQINDYPGLTAALCVVHDRTIERRINENKVAATDPLALFAYYTANEERMLFGLSDVPGALLVWVVDSTAGIEEMQWALERYAGDRQVGRRFFDIDYDYAHYRTGAPKKVTQAGFSLPNIKRHGGVCADQAYFAVSVGKAIGVPAAYTFGRDGDVSHAWVGFFEQRGRRGAWNFNEGRYQSYQGVRGVTEHPQTGRLVDDSYVSLLAEAVTLPPAKRYAAAGMVEAVSVLGQIDEAGGMVQASPPEAPGDRAEEAPRPTRGVSIPDRLALLEAAMKIDPGYAPGWLLVAGMAERGELNMAQKKTWAGYVTRLCGDRYPDFAVLVLRPIIASIDDPSQQSELWDNALRQFRRRNDLAAEIRMTQGELWEQAQDFRKAAGFYEDVIRRYGNAGPFIVPALERFEALLVKAGRDDRVLVLYREAFISLDRPDRTASQFAQQSNYYRVGQRYVAKLEAAGENATASKVRQEITDQTGLRPQ